MQDVLEVGNSLPLVITGGYAIQAHQLVDRLSRDIDVATDSGIPMEDITATVVAGLTGRGWEMSIIGVDPRSARMMATDPATGEQCELDILREVFSQTPETTPYGPVLALYDVIGTKVRALAGGGYRAISSISMQRRSCVPTPSWNPSADAMPGMGNSASASSRRVWTALNGMTTKRSPNTASRQSKSPTCAGGRRRGLTTSTGAFTWTP
jgi:hypothetical protein